jgi:hypothetical protein
MNLKMLFAAGVMLAAAACGDKGTGTESAEGDGAASAAGGGVRAVTGLPDPCEWLSVAEAQTLLGLAQPPRQTPMGNADAASRACVFTDPAQTTWINVSYQGLNPQVMSAQGRPEEALVELSGTVYANGLEHVFTGRNEGYPTLGFSDADRTILVTYTDFGKVRKLPEGIPDSLSVSSYYNVLLHLHAPEQSPDTRLKALQNLVDRPLEQLAAAASGGR